jgi:UDP-glucose:glycoprotein glucosyltransferase
MRAPGSVLSAPTLLALSAIHYIGAHASPSINVALRASFSPAPYLVELLFVTTPQEDTPANEAQGDRRRRKRDRILSNP